MATGLRPEEKKAIVSNYVKVLDHLLIGLDDVINWLYQQMFLFDSVREDIEFQPTPRKKVERLLYVVQNTDNPEAFSIFMQALEETNHRHIAKVLRDAARADRMQQVRDSWQASRQGNISDQHQAGGGTRYVCQESSQPSFSVPSGGNGGSMGSQFSEDTQVKSYEFDEIPQTLTSPTWQEAWKQSIEAGVQPPSSHGHPLGGRSSIKRRPVEKMQNVNEEASLPPRVSLTESATSTQTDSVPTDLLSNISLGSNVTSVDPEPRIPATNPQQRPQAQRLQQPPEGDRFQVKLRREPDETFGFKFVSGLGFDRARFDGDKDYYITKLYPNTIGARCGLLQENDTIVCVNGVPIRHMQFNDVVKMFQNSTEMVLIIERYTDYDVID